MMHPFIANSWMQVNIDTKKNRPLKRIEIPVNVDQSKKVAKKEVTCYSYKVDGLKESIESLTAYLEQYYSDPKSHTKGITLSAEKLRHLSPNFQKELDSYSMATYNCNVFFSQDEATSVVYL